MAAPSYLSSEELKVQGKKRTLEYLLLTSTSARL
jgi:hypothetical protein